MIKAILNLLKKVYITKSNYKTKIKYLRSLGVKIGDDCHVNSINFSTEPYLISIGNHCSIGFDTQFITHDASVRQFKPGISGGFFGKIAVGNNVFIGNHSIILLNTSIGNNCIIGAGSVVRGKIPDNSVVLGNPAKVVGNVNTVKFFFSSSKGLIQTDGLSVKDKDKLVKQVLNIS